MTSRLQKIITDARDTLADPKGERWSNARLLRLASAAQQDIAKQSKILKGQAVLALAPGKYTYDLPSDVWELTRATFESARIPFVSYTDLDLLLSRSINNSRPSERYTLDSVTSLDGITADWELDTGGDVEALIFDRRDMDSIRVYPTPDESILETSYTFTNSGYLIDYEYEANSPFGVLVDAEDFEGDTLGVVSSAESVVYLVNESCSGVESVDDAGLSSPFGLVSSIQDEIASLGFYGDGPFGVTVGMDNYTANSPYGVVTGLFDPDISEEVFSSHLGIMTQVSETNKIVGLWYTRYPADLSDIGDELEIPAMFDIAMQHYIVARAFGDDFDTRNVEKSAIAQQYYERELGVIQNTNSSNATRALQTHNNYKGFM